MSRTVPFLLLKNLLTLGSSANWHAIPCSLDATAVPWQWAEHMSFVPASSTTTVGQVRRACRRYAANSHSTHTDHGHAFVIVGDCSSISELHFQVCSSFGFPYMWRRTSPAVHRHVSTCMTNCQASSYETQVLEA